MSTMDTKICSSASFYGILAAFVLAVCSIKGGVCDDGKDLYIVYMGSLPEGETEYSPSSHHLTILHDVVLSTESESSAQDALVRSFGRSFNGFVARLSREEREKIAAKEGVLSVFPSSKIRVQTTRSWDFIGFPEGIERNHRIESDVIIGVIDTGITPDSESFSDEGFGPPPKKWKGSCHNFTCNNKIIGARSYSYLNATDGLGHGTHIASTAAGSRVNDVSFYGLAKGVARGGVPSARIAVYRTCDSNGTCLNQDILSAFDDAIADGVDIISISLGGFPVAFVNDTIAIGAFHAMEKDVLTVNSAGNDGPFSSTTYSTAPWIFSVAAGSIDRKFNDQVVLGNGKTLNGTSINAFNGRKLPLVYGSDASTDCNFDTARLCASSCLDPKLVRNKIVVCELREGIKEAVRAGAAGVIVEMEDDSPKDNAFIDPIPASELNPKEFSDVLAYLNSTTNPQAYLPNSFTIRSEDAPTVASFSSRGPNLIAEDIFKPDITAPGINILAAFSPHASPSGNSFDKRSVKYNILSGTSMACPHVTGAAVYVKSFHPQWSASAIKSALMTTASRVNTKSGKKNDYAEGEFAYGAGHINPVKALDPGLVFEAFRDDYQKMLCSINVSLFGKCQNGIKGSAKDLNYPAMQALVNITKPFTVNFPRTVRNVGIGNSTYRAKVVSDPKIHVDVEPKTLMFKALDEKKSFIVTVSGGSLPPVTRVSASLVWTDGFHSVTSPIVVYTKSQ